MYRVFATKILQYGTPFGFGLYYGNIFGIRNVNCEGSVDANPVPMGITGYLLASIYKGKLFKMKRDAYTEIAGEVIVNLLPIFVWICNYGIVVLFII